VEGMTQHFTCTINLIVLGPFLTAATGPDRYGVDKSAHRDHMERLVIPASHLKGKLRSSLEELDPLFDPAVCPDLSALFGAKSIEGSYEPVPAAVHFSDLVCANLAIEGTRTRVTINRTSQTAKQNMLRELDDLFASGTEICFTGEAAFNAPDPVTATRLASVLQLGLQWLATVGSEKSVGFGRLKSAQVSAPVETTVSLIPMYAGTSNALHLRITPQEPLLIGGIKSRRTNYLVSRQELTGGLIKGALAAALNEAHGVFPMTRPLDASCAADFPGFEALVKHFSAIRVTHARPALVGGPRPIRLPLSAVEYGEEEPPLIGDVALSDERTPLVHDRHSPAYYGDAKNLNQYEGLAEPVELFVTRSEINDVSQRTAEGQLFTYQFYAPCTKEKQPIEWICNVDFDSISESAERKVVLQQFAAAVQQHLHRLGKLGRAVTVAAEDGPAAPAVNSHPIIDDGIALMTLQSDAVMLAPDVVRSLPLGQDLHRAYAAYWDELSGGALTLDDFFAHQGFEGGYRYHRYLGAAERKNRPNNYRPYYLTLSGSLFKLRVTDEIRAPKLLTQWMSSGLPLPKWALAEYGQYNRPLWETCPFVPENGYGEIAVNLAWHWDHPISRLHQYCEAKK
jgi:CRISPR/Cas system CSM-associated protein Csm3 (group 7 of RAMP superfamily)